MVVFLMSHGADARAVNHLGETPLELGSRLTTGFPKSRTLLMSILDSSKYQITGGTIFIVPEAAASAEKKVSPRQQFLASVREEGAAGREDDETTTTRDLRGTAAAASNTATARGITFSPSRRNRRARTRYELAKSRLPYVSSTAAPSFGEGRCRSSRSGGTAAGTPALPRGDHETALGGARHRLAAGHGARCSRNDAINEQEIYSRRGVRTSHGRSGGAGGRGGGVEVRNRNLTTAPAVGVTFKNYRMGRSSGVPVSEGGFKRRRPRCSSERPSSCPVPTGGVTRSSAGSRRHRRPATTHRGDGTERKSDFSSGILRGGRGGGAETRAVSAGLQPRTRDGRHQKGGRNARPSTRRRRTKEEEEEEERGPSVPDSEARRQISEWLRESAGTASAVPPATAHGAGEYLVETSSYVATGRRSDVYKALQFIKGDGRGELISAENLRTTLCRVGQPLLPNEMEELLHETDPTGTGCVRVRGN